MKKILFLSFIMALSLAWSQDVSTNQVFFTTNQMRLTSGISIDGNFASEEGKSGMMKSFNDFNDVELTYAKIPNYNVGIDFDIYSPFSSLGFLSGVYLNGTSYNLVKENESLVDSINVTNLNIPLYAKFRFGKVESKGKMWFALGGGYSINLKAESSLYLHDQIYSTYDFKEQYNNTPYLSGILGYETIITGSGKDASKMWDRDNVRMLIYIKYDHEINNRFNDDNPLAYTMMNTSNPTEVRFGSINIGIKLLMRLTRTGKVLYESLTK